MNNGSMFAKIRDYRGQTFWEEHPFVYILGEKGIYRYEIFSAYQAAVESDTYAVSLSSEEDCSRWIGQALDNSVIDTDIRPEAADRILTLSTCSGTNYDYRWVVHASLSLEEDSVS